VIKLISKVIADFANGEISQASSLFDTTVTLQQYSDKSFYKTASLIAASCRSSAVFSNMDEQQKQAMYDYGKHLGLAFQVRSIAICKLCIQEYLQGLWLVLPCDDLVCAVGWHCISGAAAALVSSRVHSELVPA
jgi:hypothetical protein